MKRNGVSGLSLRQLQVNDGHFEIALVDLNAYDVEIHTLFRGKINYSSQASFTPTLSKINQKTWFFNILTMH